MYSPATGSGHLVVTNQDIEAASVPDGEGAPLSADARSVQVVVGDRDVLRVLMAQVVNTVVTWGNHRWSQILC